MDFKYETTNEDNQPLVTYEVVKGLITPVTSGTICYNSVKSGGPQSIAKYNSQQFRGWQWIECLV